MYKRIFLVGDGWGAVSAMKGLQNFELPVWVVSEDSDVLCFSRNRFEGKLEELQGELIVFDGYTSIVTTFVLENNICLNIHYSLLPQYRGLHSTVWAILNNEEYLGVTIHLMNRYIDDGPIIYQYKVKNDMLSTSTQYIEQFNKHIELVIANVIRDFLSDKIVPQFQNKSNASWVGRRYESDCKIDFTKSIAYQKAFFRALVKPYPLPYVMYSSKKLLVTRVGYHPSHVQTHIGRILNNDDEGIWVKIVDGYLILKELVDEQGHFFDKSIVKIGQYFQ